MPDERQPRLTEQSAAVSDDLGKALVVAAIVYILYNSPVHDVLASNPLRLLLVVVAVGWWILAVAHLGDVLLSRIR